MKKNFFSYIIILCLALLINGNSYAALPIGSDQNSKNKQSKSGNFESDNFSKSSSSSTSFKPDASQNAVPGPGGGSGGNPVPISSGMWILLLGSSVYLLKKARKEK